MQRLNVSWNGERPASCIQQVWDFLSVKLRELRQNLYETQDDFYGRICDRMDYLSDAHDAIKIVTEANKTISHIRTLHDLEKLVTFSSDHIIATRQLNRCTGIVKKFLTSVKVALGKINDLNITLRDDIFSHLETYCSNYLPLGISDDAFYKSLKARAVNVKAILAKFDTILTGLRKHVQIPKENLCDDYFSAEIAIKLNCEAFPIIRHIPDLFQKMHFACDMMQDWLRSDKVYMEQLQMEIEKTKELIKEKSGQTRQVKLEYERIFSMLKDKQLEYDDLEDNYDNIRKEMAKLEACKTRLEMELAAIARTLNNCRSQMRDLNSVENRFSDGTSEEEDGKRRGSGRLGKAQSSYRSKLSQDASAHSSKLHILRKKKKRILKKIADRRNILRDIESNESDVQRLNKKLRTLAKKKIKLTEEFQSLNTELHALENLLRSRVKIEKRDGLSTRRARKNKKVNPKPKSSRNSAKLHKAFRLVKNQIGYNWKDLFRTLPYEPPRHPSELNNEIEVIEYANQGQLREQAYQSLVKWYSYCGRRASVESLQETLRELNENRLADVIERKLKEQGLTSVPESPASAGTSDV